MSTVIFLTMSVFIAPLSWSYVADSLASGKGQNQDTVREVQAIYQEAVSLYKTNRLAEAKEKFLQADQMLPEYKSTRKYLARIEQKFSEEKQPPQSVSTEADHRTQEFLKQVREEKQTTGQNVPPEGRAVDNPTFVTSPEPDSAVEEGKPEAEELVLADINARKQELAAERENLQENYSSGLEKLYTAAVDLFLEKDWKKAQALFEDIERLQPGYQKTEDYLKRIAKELDKPAPATVASQPKEGQPDLFKELDQVKFDVPPKKIIRNEMEDKYAYAIYLFNHEKYSEAKQKFAQVSADDPDYKLTQRYLGLIRAKQPNLFVEETARRKEKRPALKEAEQQRLALQKEKAERQKKLLEDKRFKEEAEAARQKERARFLAHQQKEREQVRQEKEKLRQIQMAGQEKIRTQKDEQRKKELAKKEKIRQEALVEKEQLHQKTLAQEEERRQKVKAEKEEALRRALKEKEAIRQKTLAQQEENRQKIQAQKEEEREHILAERTETQKKAQAEKAELEQKAKAEKEASKQKAQAEKAEARKKAHEEELRQKAQTQRQSQQENIQRERQAQKEKGLKEKQRKRQALAKKAEQKQKAMAEKEARRKQKAEQSEGRSQTLEQALKAAEKKSQPAASVSEESAVPMPETNREPSLPRGQSSPQSKQETPSLSEPNSAPTTHDPREKLVEKMYREGMVLYLDKKYSAAKEKFLAVEDIKSDYRNTHQYLKELETLEKRPQ